MALPLSYNVRNLRQRWKVTLLAIVGIALVVAVFVTLLAMETGFRIALRSTGSPLNGIVTQRGSTSELTSWINIADANVIEADAHVARDSAGKAHGLVRGRHPRQQAAAQRWPARQHHHARRSADGVQRPQ